MMRIAIFGCRDGEYLQEQIEQEVDSNYEVVCFSDNNTSYHNTQIGGKPVVNIEQLAEKYRNGNVESVIVAVRKGYSRYCIIEQLKKYGIDDILLLRPSPLTHRRPIIFDKDDQKYNSHWLSLKDVKNPIIHHLEAHAADGCNLNCRGCLHFSNLYEKDEFPDIEELLNSVEEISKHCEIFQFRVLGGEPLLNPNLSYLLRKLRDILPHTDLAVISNGILVPQMPDDLKKAMLESNIGFNLTLYPPTLKMKDLIYKTLRDSGIAYGSHEAKTERFEKFMLVKEHESEDRPYETCVPKGILTVKGRKLFRCPVETYIGRFYRKFEIDLKEPEGIDVFRFSGNWSELINDLYTKPRTLCKYCSSKSEYFEWSNGIAEMKDWQV